ncbi:MAG: hypothetical protein ACTHJ3_07615 [Pararhizobium sp.]
MRTTSPDEAIAIAKRVATDFEADGGTDTQSAITAFFAEIEPALANANVDRNAYLSAVASKIRIEIASPDPQRARRSGFFSALLREIASRSQVPT